MNKIILLLFAGLFACAAAQATPTKVIVRVKAKDAKFIGNSVGGAYIIIRSKTTNEILVQGKTEGGTGNTRLIMNTPKERRTRFCKN